LHTLRQNPNDEAAKQILDKHSHELGYGLLLKRFVDDPAKATPEDIEKAAWSTVPYNLFAIFWAFRFMVAIGFFFIALFGTAFYLVARRRLATTRWFLWIALFALPLPWIANELGWFVAEYGRQPWVIEGILPTFLGVSSLTTTQVWTSLIGFVLFYSSLAIVELYLMRKYVRLGPDGMGYDLAVRHGQVEAF